MADIIKFRVSNDKGEIIGYEDFTQEFGWTHYLLSEVEEHPTRNDEYPLHNGTIKDSHFGMDFLIRDMFTGICDMNREEIYKGDHLIHKDNKMKYVVEWNQQQSSWWVMNEIFDLLKCDPHPLGNERVHYSPGNGSKFTLQVYRDGRLGNGYYHREDLILIKHLMTL